MSRPHRPLPSLGALYAAQGAAFGFLTNVLVPWLAASGASIEQQTTLFQLASVPWLLKLPVAIALDRLRLDVRRSAAVFMVGIAVTLGVLAFTTDDLAAVSWLGWAWLAINLLLASQDVAADALAIDQVEPAQRGRANGIMWCGHHVGAAVVGTMLLGAAVGRVGMNGALLVLGALFVVVAVAIGRTRQPRTTKPRGVGRGAGMLLRQPRTWLVAGVAGVVLAADIATGALSGAFLINRLQWSMETITQTLPLAILGGNVVGHLVAAAVVDRLGHAKAAALGSVSLGLLWAGFALVPGLWSSMTFMLTFIVVQVLATAVMYVGLYAWLMNHAAPQLRATHYAVLTSLLNVPRAWVPGFAPALLASLAFEGVYAVAGFYQVAVGVLLFALARRLVSPPANAGSGVEQV
ncbi:MAG: MFS transporter [Myxococcota bacterium]